MTPENYFDNEPSTTDDNSSNYNNAVLSILYDCKNNLTEKSLDNLDKILKKLENDIQRLYISYYEAPKDATLEQLLDNIKSQRKSLQSVLKAKDTTAIFKMEALLLSFIDKIIENYISAYRTRLVSTEETIKQLSSRLLTNFYYE